MYVCVFVCIYRQQYILPQIQLIDFGSSGLLEPSDTINFLKDYRTCSPNYSFPVDQTPFSNEQEKIKVSLFSSRMGFGEIQGFDILPTHGNIGSLI